MCDIISEPSSRGMIWRKTKTWAPKLCCGKIEKCHGHQLWEAGVCWNWRRVKICKTTPLLYSRCSRNASKEKNTNTVPKFLHGMIYKFYGHQLWEESVCKNQRGVQTCKMPTLSYFWCSNYVNEEKTDMGPWSYFAERFKSAIVVNFEKLVFGKTERKAKYVKQRHFHILDAHNTSMKKKNDTGPKVASSIDLLV